MQFQYWDLGRRSRGEIVEITLSGNAANVRLLDGSNYNSFKAGRRHRAIGGQVKRSPVHLQIPHGGHWYVTIDYGGYAGRGRASVQVLPGALPELRQRSLPSLAPIGENVAAMRHGEEGAVVDREWDLFISHATEDKDEVVRPLAHALQELGLRVWYDEFELRIGSSLRRKIDEGLARSRFGVVVLSHAFFAKNWSQYELDGLVTREMTGEQIILPLWHKITKAEVIGYSPSLADKLARNTSDLTVEEIAEEITGLVRAA
ncbi:MAG: DUF1883 domain-containing protein [Acidimicrobiia bacterium]